MEHPDELAAYLTEMKDAFSAARPNPGHLALAELERAGLLIGVVTQNVDGLHREAGNTDVVEVHGSIDACVCPECGGRVSLDEVLELLRAGAGTPECSACIAPLKPDVVLFGELLPADAMAEAHALAEEADLMLCVGSSLEVFPVASLPGVTLESGGRLAIVTEGRTHYDAEAEVKLAGDVVEELAAVLAAV